MSPSPGLTPELPIWSVQEGRGNRLQTELQSEKPGCGGGRVGGWCPGPSHLSCLSSREVGRGRGALRKLAGRWWSGGGRETRARLGELAWGRAAESLGREGGGRRAINTSQVTGPVNEGRELVTFRGASERTGSNDLYESMEGKKLG